MNYKKAIVFENGVTLVNDDIVTIELENKKITGRYLYLTENIYGSKQICVDISERYVNNSTRVLLSEIKDIQVVNNEREEE